MTRTSHSRDSLSNPSLQIGSVTLSDLGISSEAEGKSASGIKQRGIDRLQLIRGPDDLRMRIADTTWDNGERKVRAVEIVGPPQMAALLQRLRLTVRRIDASYSTCDLS